MKAGTRRPVPAKAPFTSPETYACPPPEAFYAAFQRHPEEAAALWARFSTDWLADRARLFDGDLQIALIFASLVLATSPPGADAERTGERITTSALARRTGIPRETIRRKLDQLRERGFAERVPGGGWCTGAQGLDARLQLDDRLLRQLSEIMAAFDRLLRD
jgi:hypothetical protein